MSDSIQVVGALVPPGTVLADELERRGWSQADFAEVLDRPVQFVSEIVTGKKEITRESAAQIGAALGQNPVFWLRLQDDYHLAKQGGDAEQQSRLDDVRLRARFNELAPVALLRKRGILRSEDLAGTERELCDLLEIADITDEPRLTHAARRSNHDSDVTSAQRAWVACVRAAARREPHPADLDKDRLRTLAQEIPRIAVDSTGFGSLPSQLADVGVTLTYVEGFPGAKIDGASMIVRGTAVVGLSGRGKRLDIVLFTLLHELAHLVLGHLDDTDDDLIVEEVNRSDGSDREREANELAGSWLLQGPLETPPMRPSGAWVERVAQEHGVNPIVIVGQLQNQKVLEWRTSLARNAPTVTEALESWGTRIRIAD